MTSTPTMRSQFEALADEIELAVISYNIADIDGLSNLDAYEAGTDKGLAVAAKLLRAFLSSAKEPQTEGWREEPDACPICDVAFKPDDLCATDIELGICHAGCLECSPVVNLNTGEPSDGRASTYLLSSLDEPDRATLIAALRTAEEALARCYDVDVWPAAGMSAQDEALRVVRSALPAPSSEGSEKPVGALYLNREDKELLLVGMGTLMDTTTAHAEPAEAMFARIEALPALSQPEPQGGRAVGVKHTDRPIYECTGCGAVMRDPAKYYENLRKAGWVCCCPDGRPVLVYDPALSQPEEGAPSNTETDTEQLEEDCAAAIFLAAGRFYGNVDSKLENAQPYLRKAYRLQAKAVLNLISERPVSSPVSDPKDLEAELREAREAERFLVTSNAALMEQVWNVLGREPHRVGGENLVGRIKELKERAESAEAGLKEAGDGLERIHNSLLSNGPKQASGEMTAYFRDRVRTLLARLDKKGDEE